MFKVWTFILEPPLGSKMPIRLSIVGILENRMNRTKDYLTNNCKLSPYIFK